MADVPEQVLEILGNRASGKLSMDTKLKDAGLDSLNAVEMIFDLEEKFDIQIPFNANNEAGSAALQTVGDVVRAVETLVAAKA